MKDVIEIVRELQSLKEEKNIVPPNVDMNEVLAVVIEDTKEDLRQAMRDGKIRYHQTLNGHTFEVK